MFLLLLILQTSTSASSLPSSPSLALFASSSPLIPRPRLRSSSSIFSRLMSFDESFFLRFRALVSVTRERPSFTSGFNLFVAGNWCVKLPDASSRRCHLDIASLTNCLLFKLLAPTPPPLSPPFLPPPPLLLLLFPIANLNVAGNASAPRFSCSPKFRLLCISFFSTLAFLSFLSFKNGSSVWPARLESFASTMAIFVRIRSLDHIHVSSSTRLAARRIPFYFFSSS